MKIITDRKQEEANSLSGSGGGGAPAVAPVTPSLSASNSGAPVVGDWKSSLKVSDDIKKWDGFNNLKDPGDAVTQLYNANKLIGVDKLPKPQETWTENQYSEFYNKLGRPEKPDGYKYPELSPDKAALFDSKQLESFKETFHKAGLTQKQAEQIIGSYVEKNLGKFEEIQKQKQSEAQKSFDQLYSKYGDQFEGKMQIAIAAAERYGLKDVLKQAGVDQDPRFIEAFIAIGETALETSPRTGQPSMLVANQAQAMNMINSFKMDKAKMDALFKRGDHSHGGSTHEAAKAEWARLHQLAYPTES